MTIENITPIVFVLMLAIMIYLTNNKLLSEDKQKYLKKSYSSMGIISLAISGFLLIDPLKLHLEFFGWCTLIMSVYLKNKKR